MNVVCCSRDWCFKGLNSLLLQCGGKNIRFVVMNNILPSYVKMHEKYDLKGSTYKRKASKSERAKNSPTLKDLDFMDLHPEGLLMEKDTYEALIKTVQRDCRVSNLCFLSHKQLAQTRHGYYFSPDRDITLSNWN